jgi:hypothetical protein
LVENFSRENKQKNIIKIKLSIKPKIKILIKRAIIIKNDSKRKTIKKVIKLIKMMININI